MGRTHGTKALTVDEMYPLFLEYVHELKGRPFLIKDWVGKDAKEVERQKERPITKEGFYVFGRKKGFTLANYFENAHGNYKEFIEVCDQIREHIRSEQIEGGMAGVYDRSITARLNGLVEKTDNKNENTNITVTAAFGSNTIQSSSEPTANP